MAMDRGDKEDQPHATDTTTHREQPCVHMLTRSLLANARTLGYEH